ncbi:cytochrome c oxidase subunit III [soil metagenome]
MSVSEQVVPATTGAASSEDAPQAHDATAAPHHTSTGLSNEKLGMWLFLGSECLLFGGLISAFLLYRSKDVEDMVGPAVDELYDIPFTSVSSFVLLMSSLTMVLALSAIQRADHRRARTWLLTTAMLGASFVAGQVYEFTAFVREGLGYTTNLQSSAFYTLTGFHGVHVTLGILMLVSLFVMSMRGLLTADRAETVEIVGLYWHFVDVVWIIIFTLIYLVPA